jgi:periplasmic divalent cation tolerance protein
MEVGVMRDDCLMVYVTVPDRDLGEVIAAALVTERHAACVNLIDAVVSYYRWDDRLQRGAECLLIAKTVRSALPGFRERVLELHSEELPELVAVPVVAGLPAYLQWVADETASGV